MENLNTEILIGSLFIAGFDKIDTALYTYTSGKLSIDNSKLKLFKFKESAHTKTFNQYIDYDGSVFKLKEGYSLDTNVSPTEKIIWPLKHALPHNQKLIEYLSNLDFSDIVLKKAKLYNIQNIDQMNRYFSLKEIEILKQLNFMYNYKNLNLKK